MTADYDLIAKSYIQTVDAKPIHIYYERPNLLSLLPANLENLNILDLGCGSGWYTETLLNQGAKVTAIDNCEEMVTFTRKRVKSQARCIQADLSKPLLDLDDNSFDILVAPLVIHYIENWYSLFAELNRVLKPGGQFIFSTHQPQAEGFLFNLESYYTKQILTDTWDNIGEVKWYHHTLEELINALCDNHFIIEKLLEPQPLAEMEIANKTMFDNICKHPWFLFMRARKSA
ncbi:MAG: class I SAM-dependent methyltransferase [Legionellales bacterium]|nr:class I SAM-dependent methyltransferase [Legionellales bacterium]